METQNSRDGTGEVTWPGVPGFDGGTMSQGNQLALEFGRQGHIISSRIFTEEDSFANTLILDP